MIQLSTIAVENNTNTCSQNNWKAKLSQCKMTTQELLEKVQLDSHPLASSEAEKLFELRVPPGYLEKIEKGQVNDPLLLQVLPQTLEFQNVEGFSDNPLNEDDFSPVKGLIHKYPNRVLLMSSESCAINCRYCFRRTFPYQQHRQSKADWQEALDYVRQHTELDEVILSGGDPLTQSNKYLFWLLSEIDAIPHIERIRIHSRLILTLPERIDGEFLAGIEKIRKHVVIVTHCNHPNELGAELIPYIDALKQRGVTVLNQSVLLKNINNDIATLNELSKSLFDLGILPYYLFIMDAVSGAAHFSLSIEDASKLYKCLQATLPGYLMPKLCVEIPGKTSKTLVNLG
jgi:EF-P beta-lysylation protein EpmB